MAFAIQAVLELVLVAILSATVTLVPVATAVIVSIVAAAVANKFSEAAIFFAFTLGASFIISTNTFCAVIELEFFAIFRAAVAAVPVTAANVIGIITVSIGFPFSIGTFPVTWFVCWVKALAFFAVVELVLIT